MTSTSPNGRLTIPDDSLAARYHGLICDLDGVVYRGPEAVPGAIDTLDALTHAGHGVAFATNNASRPPDEVEAHISELGLPSGDWSVVTSSEAAAAYLAAMLSPAARVLAVGGPGVSIALLAAGLTPVRAAELDGAPVEAVVQGLGQDVTYRELDEVAHQTRQGVPWVATNLDITLPSARGPAPGNGALVGLVRTATSAEPHITGKPGPDLYELARVRLGTEPADTLGIGDRLDTDIAGANAAGIDSLLVLSGAATLQELAAAPEHYRPTYVAMDLTGMLSAGIPLPAPDQGPEAWAELERQLGVSGS